MVATHSQIDFSDRHTYIGASEVACLFGVGWTSLFELWHLKKQTIAPVESDNERLFWGTYLEPSIARGFSVMKGWKVRNVRRTVVHPTVDRFRVHPDYEIIGDHGIMIDDEPAVGAGDMEIKTVDSLIFKDYWTDGPPLSYEIQLQAQLACSGRSWGAIAALVGGNSHALFLRRRHDRLIEEIERRVEGFWRSVDLDIEPEPNFTRDVKTISRLYGVEKHKILDVSDDAKAARIADAYFDAHEECKEADERKQAAKAELEYMCKDHELMLGNGFKVKRTEVPETKRRKGHTRMSIRRMKDADN